MRYQLRQIHCRPWTLNGLSLRLIALNSTLLHELYFGSIGVEAA